MNYRPTAELRILELPMGQMGSTHPAGYSPWADSRVARVLQQKWISDYVGEEPVWRDVPLETPNA